MCEIRTLIELDPASFCQVMQTGYTSTEKFAVRKTESDTAASIQLELVHLDQPYIKDFTPTEEDIQRYHAVVKLGWSLAAYAGDRMVAVAIAEPREWNRTVWVWELHVAEDQRGRGLAGNCWIGWRSGRGRLVCVL